MSGPVTWGDTGGTPGFVGGFWFDGVMLHAGAAMPPYSGGAEPNGVLVPTLGGGSVNQVFTPGGTAPLGRQPFEIDLSVQIIEEDDFHRINRAWRRGTVVDVWFDWPMEDEWSIPLNQHVTGTTWRTSAKLPYNSVAGIDQAARPPSAWRIDYSGTPTSMTVVTGSPSAGELQIPDASGYTDLKSSTGDLDPDNEEYLRVRYHPMWAAKVTDFAFSYDEHNDLVVRLRLVESMGAIYDLAPGIAS